MHKVLIEPSSYESVSDAIERVFEIFPLDIKGKRVLIKPNVLRASEAADGIVTNPALLRAVVDKVERMLPASLIVGDNPGLFSYGDNERSFESTGLMEAAKGYYLNIGNDSVRYRFNPEFMDSVSLSEAIVSADIVISLPKFKTHGLTVMTGAIKNSFGFLPGAQKAMLHKAAGCPERFHDVIVEVFRLRVPDLFIVDAITGMEGNGPASPDLREIGLVLASYNGVAIDSVMARMMGCEPSRLRFLKKAKAAGLGDYELPALELIGELKAIPGFKLPPLGGEAMMSNERIQNLIHCRVEMRPQADPELCTGCGACVEHCPVEALFMEGAIPAVRPELCIACFCCQEICPVKAIALK